MSTEKTTSDDSTETDYSLLLEVFDVQLSQ